MVDRIVLEAKRIIFAHEPFTKTEATTPLGIITSVSAHSLKAAKKARILCFPRAEALDARLYLSHFIHIDKSRHVELEISCGSNELARADVRLKSASAGLRLRTANVGISSGNAAIVDKSTPGLITLGAMSAGSSSVLKVPYDMESILQDLSIKVEIDYHTDNGQFQYFSTFTIPVELPLDVNVHDHFKRSALLSKFNIKTASHVPLQLFNVELQSSEEYSVTSPRRAKNPLYVFAKQPVAVTYKITKNTVDPAQRRQSKAPAAGSLALSVEYRCLDEDVKDRICKLFASSVTEGSVRQFSRLLRETFTEHLVQKVLPHQFERIALLDKVDMGAFEDMGWTECLDGLPQAVREDTRAWLKTWHEVRHQLSNYPLDAN